MVTSPLHTAATAIRGKRILVVGDWIADENINGETARISREAPVLILEYQGRELFPGGASNTINNLVALGAAPIPVGVIGEDALGSELLDFFRSRSVDVSGVLADASIATTVKTRVFGGGPHSVRQQMVRIDRGSRSALEAGLRQRLIAALETAWPKADMVLVSDYGYGVVGPDIRDWLLAKAKTTGKRMIVDSRWEMSKFVGATSITPNEPEAESLLGTRLRGREDVERAGRELLGKLGCKAVLITRGPNGMALFEPGQPTDWIDVYGTDEVADVTGAGDTVIATYTAALAGGASYGQAARLANLAGGCVVRKRGTAVVPLEELLAAVEDYTKS